LLSFTVAGSINVFREPGKPAYLCMHCNRDPVLKLRWRRDVEP
jgi:hypothetical protein